MHQGIRLAALFMGYGVLGFSGDYAMSLLAHEPAVRRDVQVKVVVPDAHVSVATAGSDRCAYGVERRVRLSASQADRLRLEAGSGELRVEGRAGLGAVEAVGKVCASDQAYLDDLTLTLESRGGEVFLETHYPEGRHGWRGEDYARIDLTVMVPEGMAVDLEDSSGGMEISGTGALRIDDSSGDILVHDVNGDVDIDDSSGGLRVRDVVGRVSIEDGSGSIDVSGIRGDLRLDDGSGSIEAVDVQGNVEVADDGSGSIRVRDVGGDFRVRSDGSGSIRYSGVSGTVDIPRDKRRGR